MFTIDTGKEFTVLRGDGITFTAKTMFSGPDFALTFNKYKWEFFGLLAAMEGVTKLSENSCTIEAEFEGKKVLVGIYRDTSEYHSEFVVPDRFRNSLE